MYHHGSGRSFFGLIILSLGLLLLAERPGLVEASVGSLLWALWPLLLFGIPGYFLLQSDLDHGFRVRPGTGQ